MVSTPALMRKTRRAGGNGFDIPLTDLKRGRSRHRLLYAVPAYLHDSTQATCGLPLKIRANGPPTQIVYCWLRSFFHGCQQAAVGALWLPDRHVTNRSSSDRTSWWYYIRLAQNQPSLEYFAWQGDMYCIRTSLWNYGVELGLWRPIIWLS